MPPIIDNDLAYGGVAGTFDPVQLFAGDAPIVTAEETVASGQGVLAKYTVVAKNAAGKLVVLAPAAVDGTEIAVGITTQRVDATSGDVRVAMYKAGFFNHLALVWPAATNTLTLRKAAFERTPIMIGAVRL